MAGGDAAVSAEDWRRGETEAGMYSTAGCSGTLWTPFPHLCSLLAAGSLAVAAEGDLHNFASQWHGRTVMVHRGRQFPPVLSPKLPWQLPDSWALAWERAAQDKRSRGAQKGRGFTNTSPSPGKCGCTRIVGIHVRVCTFTPYSL